MGLELSSETIARLKERAGNAERRSDASELEANSPGIADMMAAVPKSDDPAVREYLEGMNTPFAGMISNMVTGDGSKAGGLFGALGLPEKGWETKVWEGLDLSKIKHPTPGYAERRKPRSTEGE